MNKLFVLTFILVTESALAIYLPRYPSQNFPLAEVNSVQDIPGIRQDQKLLLPDLNHLDAGKLINLIETASDWYSYVTIPSDELTSLSIEKLQYILYYLSTIGTGNQMIEGRFRQLFKGVLAEKLSFGV